MRWIYSALAVMFLFVLIYSLSVGPIYARPSMTGPPSTQILADALLRLEIAGLGLTCLLWALQEWHVFARWAAVGKRVAAICTALCAIGFLLLIYAFHLGPKPQP